jgi:hypothetical protein
MAHTAAMHIKTQAMKTATATSSARSSDAPFFRPAHVSRLGDFW